MTQLLERGHWQTSHETSSAAAELLTWRGIEPRSSRTAASSEDVVLAWQETLPGWLGMIHGGFGSTWQREVLRRIGHLSQQPQGWDSHDASPLRSQAVFATLIILRWVEPLIRSSPLVSLTADGGLLCEWIHGDDTVELVTDGEGHVELGYYDATHDVEWSGSPQGGQRWQERLWQTSSGA
jgi:hypothetical protein